MTAATAQTGHDVRYSFRVPKRYTTTASEPFMEVPKKFYTTDLAETGIYVAHTWHHVTKMLEALTRKSETRVSENIRAYVCLAASLEMSGPFVAWGSKELAYEVSLSAAGAGGGRAIMMSAREIIGMARYVAHTRDAATVADLLGAYENDAAVKEIAERIYVTLTDVQRAYHFERGQELYFKEHAHAAHTARVFEDKLHTSHTHKAWALRAQCGPWFNHIEIDNDVTESDWGEFDTQVAEVMAKLPWSKNHMPALRVRYLGRHKASGIFFPHVNAIAVDVRSSASFIHEYGHHLDVIVYGQNSMRREFAPIRNHYANSIVFPEEVRPRKRQYYKTPTEIFARAFTYYWAHKLSPETRLLDHTRATTAFDHVPFAAIHDTVMDYFDQLLTEIDQPERWRVAKPAASGFTVCADRAWENVALF